MMKSNPSLAELEWLITARVLGTRFGKGGAVRERIPRQDIVRVFRLVANSVLYDLGISDKYRVITNPISGTFLIHEHPRRLLCKLEIDGVYDGAFVARPRAILMDKQGGMKFATLQDLADQKLMALERRKHAKENTR